APAPAPVDNGRSLGLWMCVALVVGNIIGISVFLLPASLAPFGFNALTGWLVTLTGCLVLAGVFAALARRFPEAEGPFSYIRGVLGETAAFVAGWCYWVSCWCGNPVLAIGVVGYLKAAIPGLAALPDPLVALALLWAFVGVNVLGLRAGGGVQMITTALKLLPMAAIILLGLWIAVSAPATFVRHLPATPLSLTGAMTAATLTLFAMLGIECATIPAGRVRDPGRTVPLATMAGVAVSAAIYIAVSTIPMLLTPQAELARQSAPFVDLLNRLAVPGSGRWLAAFVVISGLGALNGWTLITGEMTRTMAAAGSLPAVLARTNGRGAPAVALLVSGALGSLLVAMSSSRSLVQAFTFMINVVTAASLPLYLLAAAALAAVGFAAREGASRRLVILGLAGVGYCVFAFIGIGWEPFVWALGLAAAGLPVLALQRLRRRRLAAAAA
ncbi:MAG TPA: amino acid permease, partial [Caulobacteraceae bacterium]|nr:amino acid permease [Caulobacteraceae bacterium]